MIGEVLTFQRTLVRWYRRHARQLPWRITLADTRRPDPYHVLVSEFMLQQTQVATVLPFFAQFLRVFPTITDLARAQEQQVLRLWQGLGYYSRARNLLKAARTVVEHHAGALPATVDELLQLPGVGRYTAGAIASIAHGTRAPILDGNVMRVLCRIDAIRSDPREKSTNALLWSRAEAILPRDHPGDFNSALMELGATVCTPRNPQCLICPVAHSCTARELGIQEQIPPVKKALTTPHTTRWVYCIYRMRKGTREYAFEQRPPTGRWAGMWQFLTRTARDDALEVGPELTPLGCIDHALTHRRYTFNVALAGTGRRTIQNATWHTLASSESIPLPRPHVKIREMLRNLPGKDVPLRRSRRP